MDDLPPSYTREQVERLYALGVHEITWRDRQQFLASHGYMLRPRYHPDWVPSWRGSDELPMDFEDGITLPARVNLIDATRISDGQLVYIKRVTTRDEESRIALMFMSETFAQDPRNHSVPIFDVFQDSEDENISYMVMPFLRPLNNPMFDCVDEVLDLVDQLLTGLVFLHENGVAHRDCSHKNILMDGKSLYPRGFHPVHMDALPDGIDSAPAYTRTTHPVKYYYVDFGISVHIPPDVHPKLVVGGYGRDQEPPELSFEVPYDPFKLDVFILGNLFRRELYDRFSNLEFLTPIISTMTQADPSSRPTAAELLQQWTSVRRNVGFLARRWSLVSRKDDWRGGIIRFPEALLRMSTYLVRQLLWGA